MHPSSCQTNALQTGGKQPNFWFLASHLISLQLLANAKMRCTGLSETVNLVPLWTETWDGVRKHHLPLTHCPYYQVILLPELAELQWSGPGSAVLLTFQVPPWQGMAFSHSSFPSIPHSLAHSVNA